MEIITAEQQVCLDPSVSLDARDLIRLGRMEAAREIVQFCVDQGTTECAKDDVYNITTDDLNFLREKYGLEIN